MLHDWGVIAAAFAYIGLLFGVASYGDRLSPSQRGRASMLIYPLSLAIYCTSWTFFGSVGFATRTSTDFLAIYVGPILMIGLCTPLLRRVIQLAKSQNITSIADFIAARYGKSQAVAATVALIAIIAVIAIRYSGWGRRLLAVGESDDAGRPENLQRRRAATAHSNSRCRATERTSVVVYRAVSPRKGQLIRRPSGKRVTTAKTSRQPTMITTAPHGSGTWSFRVSARRNEASASAGIPAAQRIRPSQTWSR